MFKRVLVPVDGSLRSEAAIPVAARLARRTGGSILLLRSYSLPLRYAFPFGPASVDPQEREAVHRALTAYLTHLSDLPVLSGIETETILTTEPGVAAILDTAANGQCDSIVLTSHGRTGVSRWALGSVARQVARWATVPVLLLRSSAPPDKHETHEAPTLSEMSAQSGASTLFGGSPSAPLGILIPLDGSPLGEAAIEPALALAQAMATSHAGSPGAGAVHLLLALWPADTRPDNMPEALAELGAFTYLQHLVARFQPQAPNVRITWSVVSALDPASAILQVAEGTLAPQTHEHTLISPSTASPTDAQNDLHGEAPDPHGYGVVAMWSHGRTGPNLWLMGSVAERVLDATHLPVLLVHEFSRMASSHNQMGSEK